MKKDKHYGEYSFSACLPRPTLIPPPLPLALPVETTTTIPTTSNRFYFIILYFPFYRIRFIIVVLAHRHYVLFGQIHQDQLNRQIRPLQILMVRKHFDMELIS
jgi:hypothetical protein